MAELRGLFEVSCPEELVDGKQHVFLAFWTQQTVDFMILIVSSSSSIAFGTFGCLWPLGSGVGGAYQACG